LPLPFESGFPTPANRLASVMPSRISETRVVELAPTGVMKMSSPFTKAKLPCT
jgi:hypothetical protein